MSISVDLWPQPAVKVQVQHQHIPASLLCARASYKPPRAWPSSSKRFISHQFTPSSVWFFFSLFPCLFFLFWKRKYGFIKAQSLSITLYRALFLSINLPDFFFFTWCSELVIRLWLLMPPDTNPVHYSPTYKIMTYPPPTLWDLPGPWSRLNASFMGTLLSATLLHYPKKIPQSMQSLLRHKHKTRPTGKERQMAYIFLFFELIDW